MDYKEIVICKYCSGPEYWGEMRWLSAKELCRDCYREAWEDMTHKRYKWDDLDGKRPTMEEYNKQNNR